MKSLVEKVIPDFIGDLDPSDESVPFEEEVEELVFAPTDKPVEDLVICTYG